MKKLIYLAIAASAMLASCATDSAKQSEASLTASLAKQSGIAISKTTVRLVIT